VCPRKALKVGAAFIYVDWRTCDGCLACVEACDRNAIVNRTVPTRSSAAVSTVPLADVSKVVVGSRAEAKAVRQAAERAAKEQKGGKGPKQAAPKAAVEASDADGLLPPPPAMRPASAESAVPRPAEKRAPMWDAAARPSWWTLADAAAVIAVMLAALLAKNAVLALPQVALMPALGKMVTRSVVLTAYYAAQLAAFGWLAGRHGLPAARAFGLRREKEAREGESPSAIGSAGLVLALFFVCEAVSIGYGLVMRAAGIVPPERLSTDLAGVFGSGPAGLLVAVVLVAIAAPFAEEIAFRGIVLPALGARWGMWVAIGTTAVLYAAFHANVWLFAPSAFLGVALGWLAWTRRSLWPACALHVLYNAAAVAAAFITSR
jgi:membrane protease YdiL (CAAX protease family)/Fe-S-cluster-containing hydrogenase component 2